MKDSGLALAVVAAACFAFAIAGVVNAHVNRGVYPDAIASSYIDINGQASGDVFVPYGEYIGFVNSDVGISASSNSQMDFRAAGGVRFQANATQLRASNSAGAMIQNISSTYNTPSVLASWGDGGGLGYDQTNNHVTIAGPASNPGLAVGFQTKRTGTSVTAPYTCDSETETPTFVYVDDTDDSAAGQFCVCVATGDDGAGAPNAWNWINILTGSACTLI